MPRARLLRAARRGARAHLVATDHHTHCPFKGDASYYSIRVGEREAANAIWYYPKPIEAVAEIAGHVAFYTDRVDRFEVED
ncbi:MAG: DUF427 domain-containing protein [Myxococcales bacterium]|nr:DUF427 domain-containing protein [Myxococcales bacterium]